MAFLYTKILRIIGRREAFLFCAGGSIIVFQNIIFPLFHRNFSRFSKTMICKQSFFKMLIFCMIVFQNRVFLSSFSKTMIFCYGFPKQGKLILFWKIERICFRFPKFGKIAFVFENHGFLLLFWKIGNFSDSFSKPEFFAMVLENMSFSLSFLKTGNFRCRFSKHE